MRYFNSAKTTFLPGAFVVFFLTICAAISASAQNLETREIDLKGCIQTSFRQEFIIRTQEDFLKAIRDDASRDYCLKNLEKIDFEKTALLGIELNTGYCRRPFALEARAVKNEAERQIILQIAYEKPRGTCRALSRYDFWVLVPKIPENFTVIFDAKAMPNDRQTQ